MYEIHIRGEKKAVLLALGNAVGFYEPEILLEEGRDNQYVVHSTIETKWDAAPFGEEEQSWNGKTIDLSEYSEEAIRNGDYLLCFNGFGVKNLSGLLNVEIEILNRPDDDYNPFCEFESYANGKHIETSRFNNPCFEGEEPDDMDPEEIAELFDEWHEFHF